MHGKTSNTNMSFPCCYFPSAVKLWLRAIAADNPPSCFWESSSATGGSLRGRLANSLLFSAWSRVIWESRSWTSPLHTSSTSSNSWAWDRKKITKMRKENTGTVNCVRRVLFCCCCFLKGWIYSSCMNMRAWQSQQQLLLPPLSLGFAVIVHYLKLCECLSSLKVCYK